MTALSSAATIFRFARARQQLHVARALALQHLAEVRLADVRSADHVLPTEREVREHAEEALEDLPEDRLLGAEVR